MMYSYVVSKTLNFPLRSWGTKARLAAGEPCEGEKTHTPQPPKFWGPGKAENWQRLLTLSQLHLRLLLSPTWPPSGCPSLDSTPRLLLLPDSTLHAEGLVQGAERHAGPGWLAACTSTCPTPGGQPAPLPMSASSWVPTQATVSPTQVQTTVTIPYWQLQLLPG